MSRPGHLVEGDLYNVVVRAHIDIRASTKPLFTYSEEVVGLQYSDAAEMFHGFLFDLNMTRTSRIDI